MPYIGQPPVTGDTTTSFRLLDSIASYTQTFDATSSDVVSVANDTLTFNQHRFVTAQRVTYTSGGGTAIGGLTSGTAYFIIKVDQNTIKLATSAANANANTAINLTTGATGTSHTLNVAFDGVNTKFKATYNNGTKAQISRPGQLILSVNGVIQQAQETSTPTVGYGLEADSTIVFAVAPATTDVMFGNVIANTIPNFDTTSNTVDNFTGDGSTTSFTLSKTPSSSNDVLVTLNGVVQYPTNSTTVKAYSVTGATLTFVSAPANGVEIQVRHIGFAGATSSAVTGFYGRTGNAVLTSADDVTIQNLVAVAATFSGNVSIAGTLTYEDVTNIDSIGLITARSGIEFGTRPGLGASISPSGNAVFAGVVTATTYRVGTAVTINSSGINVVGVITATSFSGVSDTNYWASTNAGINTTAKVGIGTTNPSAKLEVSGNAVGQIVTLTDGATITPDFSTANNFTVTLGGNRTIANPSNIVAGQSGFISIVQDGTGSRTVGWGSHWDFPASTAPTLTTTANGVDIVAYYVRTTTSIAADAIIGIGTL